MKEKDDRQLAQEDVEFIRERMRLLDDQIQLPPSLRPEALRHKISAGDRHAFREAAHPDFRSWQRYAAYVAALILVVTAYVGLSSSSFDFIGALMGGSAPEAQMAAPEAGPEAAGIAMDDSESNRSSSPRSRLYAAEYADLAAEARDILERQSRRPVSLAEGRVSEAQDAVYYSAGAGKETVAPMSYNGNGTNLQVQGVDESDILKSDGDYLYYYSPSNYQRAENLVSIIDVREMKVVSSIDTGANDGVELYVDGDRLVVLIKESQGVPADLYDDNVNRPVEPKSGSTLDSGQTSAQPPALPAVNPYGSVTLSVYSLEDVTQPRLERTFQQDGSYVSSRMASGVVYLITSKHLVPELVTVSVPMLYNTVPVVRDSALGYSQAVPASSVAVAPGSTSGQYAVVSALDIHEPRSPVDTNAVLGGGKDIYMSERNLYVYYDVYNSGSRATTTGIVRLAVNRAGLRVAAQTTLDGSVNNQFSMDERNGRLRVATTSTEFATGTLRNNLYVLDENLRLTGSVEGIAPGERIHSTRFVGDMAYIVTFRQTDPLFAIDLSNPADPRIMGQLELPGVSEYLHPVDENNLIGLGRNVVEEEDGGTQMEGIKLSWFDVSDPLNPRETHSLVLPGEESYSEALENHKAFLFSAEDKIIGFPMISREAPTGASTTGRLLSWGFAVYEYDPDYGFEDKGVVSHAELLTDTYILNNFRSIERGVCIGGLLYTCSNSRVLATDLSTMETVGQVELI